MRKYEKVKEYLINIDFDMIDDSDLLDNVYREIETYEETLLLDMDVVSNFELLIKKSNISQILTLCKKLNFPKIAIKKTGSKFLEIIFIQIINLNCNKKELKKLKNVVINPINDNFKNIICNKNGTHVIRKYFELLKNKEIFQCYKTEILKILNEEIEVDILVTIICYLKLSYSRTISRKIIEVYFSSDNCKNKIFSYVFEDLINISDKKTIQKMFLILKNCYSELINNNIASFVVIAFIKKYLEQTDFFYENITNFQNMNVILGILENYVKLKNYKKVNEIFKNFYGVEDDVFKFFLLSRTDTPDTKFINLICLLMDVDKYDVNKDFCEYFEKEWIHKKYGLCLMKAFLEGQASKKLKIGFAKKFNFSRSLSTKKDGKKILSLIKSYRKLIK